MAEAILLRWDADDNAHVAAWLSVENRRRFDDLNEAVVVAVYAVAPKEAIVE